MPALEIHARDPFFASSLMPRLYRERGTRFGKTLISAPERQRVDLCILVQWSKVPQNYDRSEIIR